MYIFIYLFCVHVYFMHVLHVCIDVLCMCTYTYRCIQPQVHKTPYREPGATPSALLSRRQGWGEHQPTWCESLCLSTRRPPGTPSQPTAHRQPGNCCTCQPRFHDGNLSWLQPVRKRKAVCELLQALSDTCSDLLFRCAFLSVLSKGSAMNHSLTHPCANA